MSKERENEKDHRGYVVRRPGGKRRGKQLGTRAGERVEARSFGSPLEKIGNHIWPICPQPIQSLLMQIGERDRSTGDQANALHDRSIWPVLASLVALIGPRAIDADAHSSFGHR